MKAISLQGHGTMPNASEAPIELAIGNVASLTEANAYTTTTTTTTTTTHRDSINDSEGDTIVRAQQLEPADRGLAAWRLLIAAFVFEALLCGQSLLIFSTKSRHSSS